MLWLINEIQKLLVTNLSQKWCTKCTYIDPAPDKLNAKQGTLGNWLITNFYLHTNLSQTKPISTDLSTYTYKVLCLATYSLFYTYQASRNLCIIS